jgi:uncharacterized protein (DUF58 family)
MYCNEVGVELGARSGGLKRLQQSLLERWQLQFMHWVNRRIPPASKVILTHRNIFILPNKQGLGFLFVLSLMLVGAINYEANLAFALVFLLLGMFVLSIFHTFRNLLGLHISAVPGAAVFAGEKAEITVILNRQGSRVFENLHVSFPATRKVVADLVTLQEERLNLYVPTHRRGRLAPGRLIVETLFPFGICRAWSLIDLNLNCLVYPAPVECDLDWLVTNQPNTGHTHLARGNDDFQDLREYQRGDSLKHVAWKIFARGQGMYTKQYASNMDERIWLRWDMFAGLDTEARLSRLCYCVLKLDSAGVDYGLELPGVNLAPAKGAVHFAKALEILALYTGVRY